MSSFITGLGLILVDLPLRIYINGLYIFLSLFISSTDIVNFDIMLVEEMLLKFFTFGRPTLLYIFLANLALSIYLRVNPTIVFPNVVKTLEFAVVYVGLNTYRAFLFIMNLMIPILV